MFVCWCGDWTGFNPLCHLDANTYTETHTLTHSWQDTHENEILYTHTLVWLMSLYISLGEYCWHWRGRGSERMKKRALLPHTNTNGWCINEKYIPGCHVITRWLKGWKRNGHKGYRVTERIRGREGEKDDSKCILSIVNSMSCTSWKEQSRMILKDHFYVQEGTSVALFTRHVTTAHETDRGKEKNWGQRAK